MAKIIYDNMSIGTLEARITRLIRMHQPDDPTTDLEYWGDLGLTLHEYETLKNRLCHAISNEPCLSDLNALRQYPVCVVTFAIFLIRYEFDDNFWDVFSNALQLHLDPNSQRAIGGMFCDTLKQYGFQTAPLNSGRRYINSLLLQLAAPPDCTMPDLFYVLRNEKNRFFDPYRIVDALTSWSDYLIRKPLLHFLIQFRDTRAIDLLVKVHETMQNIDNGGEPSTPLAEQYKDWCNRESKQKETHIKNTHQIQLPYLNYEIEGRGLCMILPRIQMEKEWIEEVRWKITSDHNSYEGLNQVFGTEDGRYVAEHSVAVQPANCYTVELFDAQINDQALFSKSIPGIDSSAVFLFDTRGNPIVRSNWLPEEGVVLLSGPDAIWQISSDMLSEKLSAFSNGYTATLLLPQSEHATLTIRLSSASSPTHLRIRSRAKLSLHGETLFGLPTHYWPIPIFITFPIVTIDTKTSQEQQELFLKFVGQKKSMADLTDTSVPLTDFLSQPPAYGKYSLRLYQQNQMIRFLEFYYLPTVESDYATNLSWDLFKIQTKRYLSFSLPKNTSLSFSNATYIENNGEVNVSFPANLSQLSGTLFYQQDDVTLSIDLQLPLLPCQWHLFDSTTSDDITDLTFPIQNFKSKSLLLHVQFYGACSTDRYVVALQSVNGVEQQLPLVSNRRRTATLSLSAFADTIDHIPLPARLVLLNLAHAEQPLPLLSITETPVFSMRPRAGLNRRCLAFPASQSLPPMLELTPYGNTCSSILLDCSKAYPHKKDKNLSILPCDLLPDGIYTVTATSTYQNNFMPISSSYLSIHNNVFAVPRLPRVKPDEIHTVKAYIQQAIYDILLWAGQTSDGFSSSCCMQVHPSSAWRNTPLDHTDLTELVAIAEFALIGQIPRQMQHQIRLLMQRISENVLTGYSRWQLTCRLIELHCHQDVFDLCREQYGLILLISSGAREQRLEIAQALTAYSRELALLTLQQLDLPIYEILRWDNQLLLDSNALLSMLAVSEGTPPDEANQLRIAFLREQPGTKVHITLSKELSGEMRLVSEMIRIEGNNVFYNYQKEKISALYFCQSRYLDLYANWVRITEAFFGTEDGAFQKERVMQAVKDGQPTITSGLRNLRNSDSTRNIIEPYAHALHARQSEGCMSNPASILSFPRFFYLLGIAALLYLLKDSQLVSDHIIQAAELYLSRAASIAPRITQRDIVMASTYLYLKKKEHTLCQ